MKQENQRVGTLLAMQRKPNFYFSHMFLSMKPREPKGRHIACNATSNPQLHLFIFLIPFGSLNETERTKGSAHFFQKIKKTCKAGKVPKGKNGRCIKKK